MKARIANKIYKRLEEDRWRATTLGRMCKRHDKFETTKEVERYWNALMERIGPFGRFDLAVSCGLWLMEDKIKGATP